jgi:hypothetical protein
MNAQQSEHRLPFGKHRGRPLAEVPADYLLWALQECKLSSGLRAAIAAEYERRYATCEILDAPPPAPEPSPLPACRQCGVAGIIAHWQEDCAGGRRIRGECVRCGRFLCWLPQLEPWIRQADYNASPTPVLDVLTQLDDLGIELESDGHSMQVPLQDWQRVPPELHALIRQCSHQLARMLGRTA